MKNFKLFTVLILIASMFITSCSDDQPIIDAPETQSLQSTQSANNLASVNENGDYIMSYESWKENKSEMQNFITGVSNISDLSTNKNFISLFGGDVEGANIYLSVLESEIERVSSLTDDELRNIGDFTITANEYIDEILAGLEELNDETKITSYLKKSFSHKTLSKQFVDKDVLNLTYIGYNLQLDAENYFASSSRECTNFFQRAYCRATSVRIYLQLQTLRILAEIYAEDIPEWFTDVMDVICTAFFQTETLDECLDAIAERAWSAVYDFCCDTFGDN